MKFSAQPGVLVFERTIDDMGLERSMTARTGNREFSPDGHEAILDAVRMEREGGNPKAF